MGNEKTILLVGGGALVAYLLMPEKVRDAIGGGGSFTSINVGESVGQAADKVKEVVTEGAGGIATTVIKETAAEAGTDFFDKFFEYLKNLTTPPSGGETEDEAGKKPPAIPTRPTSEAEVDQTWQSQGVKETIAGKGVAIAGTFVATKTVPRILMALAPKFFPKLMLGATGIGAPVAFAWTAAELLATGYEWLTGANVPFLGVMEAFREDGAPVTTDKATRPESDLGGVTPFGGLPDTQAVKESQSGNPEAPTKDEFSHRGASIFGSPIVSKNDPSEYDIEAWY